MPWPALQKLVTWALTARAQLVADSIRTRLPTPVAEASTTLDDWIATGVSQPDLRRAIGDAAKAGDWFTQIEPGERLGLLVSTVLSDVSQQPSSARHSMSSRPGAMTTDPTQTLAEAPRAFVIAAAGCGKTEEIARAVALNTRRPQLILTHTHAGVRALRDRLASLKVSSQRYNVETIAGWALKYAASYPTLAELMLTNPTGDDWAAVYEAAARVLRSSAVQEVVAATYGGVYVDEYQDCTKRQHHLVMQLAKLLPCRLLGDPLQGIFDFEEDPVKWAEDIEPHFERLPGMTTPWRWLGKNPALGDRLAKIRQAMMQGDPIGLARAPHRLAPIVRHRPVE